jgi:hypothetical protein
MRDIADERPCCASPPAARDHYYFAESSYTQGNYKSNVSYFFVTMVTFWLLYSYLVPISLFVTIEIVKFIQVRRQLSWHSLPSVPVQLWPSSAVLCSLNCAPKSRVMFIGVNGGSSAAGQLHQQRPPDGAAWNPGLEQGEEHRLLYMLPPYNERTAVPLSSALTACHPFHVAK